MNEILLYVVLTLTPYTGEAMDVQVSIPFDSMSECTSTLEDITITEGPELSIFGTSLDIDAWCSDPNNLKIKTNETIDDWLERIQEQEQYEQRQEYKRTS